MDVLHTVSHSRTSTLCQQGSHYFTDKNPRIFQNFPTPHKKFYRSRQMFKYKDKRHLLTIFRV